MADPILIRRGRSTDHSLETDNGVVRRGRSKPLDDLAQPEDATGGSVVIVEGAQGDEGPMGPPGPIGPRADPSAFGALFFFSG